MAPIHTHLLAKALVLSLLLVAVGNADSSADHGIPWLKTAEVHTEEDHSVYRRMLGDRGMPQVDPYFFAHNEVQVISENGQDDLESKPVTCEVIPVPHGVSTFCDNKLVSGLVTDNRGGNVKFMQRIDEQRVVSYYGKDNLIQPELEGKRTFLPKDAARPVEVLDDDLVETEVNANDNNRKSLLRQGGDRNLLDLSQEYLKFLDVFVVVDFPTFQAWGGTVAKAEAKAVTILAQAKQIFLSFRPLPFGVNVRLAGIRVFNSRDPFKPNERSASELLNEFNTWRVKQNLGATYAIAHLFTARELLDLVGYYARTPVVCNKETSSTLSSSLTSSDGFAAKLVAHALGHALGIQNTNTFSDAWGVSMQQAIECNSVADDVMRVTLPVDSADYVWGNCAPIWFKTFLSGFPHGCGLNCNAGGMQMYGLHSSFPMCLESTAVPKIPKNKLPACGDGVLDAGEDCDCGIHLSDEICRSSYCCNRETCKSIPNCSTQNAPTVSPIRKNPTARPTPHPTYKPSFECYYLCAGNGNGICEDGGPDSSSGFCFYGSDCLDCGVREPYTSRPTVRKTVEPTTSGAPSVAPTFAPTNKPVKTSAPTTLFPTTSPTNLPTDKPSSAPTNRPTPAPVTQTPSKAPRTKKPTSDAPTKQPTATPSAEPTLQPTVSTNGPTSSPTTQSPSAAPIAPTTPTSVPTTGPTTAQCLPVSVLKRCRGIAKDPCNARKDCAFCVLANGSKRCLPTVPGFGNCSNKLVTYMQECTNTPEEPEPEETSPPSSSNGNEVIPTQTPTAAPAAGQQCPPLATLQRCKLSNSDCASRKSECTVCKQSNGKNRCVLIVDGITRCSAQHNNFVTSCIKSGGGNPDEGGEADTVAPSSSPSSTTSTVTVAPTPSNSNSVVCPAMAVLNKCKVGPEKCADRRADGCRYCSNLSRCLSIGDGVWTDLVACSDDHASRVAQCQSNNGGTTTPEEPPRDAPITPSPTTAISGPVCPSKARLDDCKVGKMVNCNTDKCAWCPSIGRCLALVPGIETCSADHQPFIKVCNGGSSD